MINQPLIVMALESECQGRFTDQNIIYTGIGKINAAYHLTKCISKTRPTLVVNLGSAGSSFFKKGSVINCTQFIQKDMDVRPLGFQKWETPFESSGTILKYGKRISHLEEGICGTGDSFDMSHDAHAYHLVDMEAYALAKICQKEEIPFICLKYISDGADDTAADDWNASLKHAAKMLFEEYQKLNIHP